MALRYEFSNVLDILLGPGIYMDSEDIDAFWENIRINFIHKVKRNAKTNLSFAWMRT